ncbi:hypothetical protein DFH09DRAFT_1082495 [Mycena vulgaris]|nr:hypothetical protein DFH09DRAFT_1082495 [Mycena vulgaris]
MLKGVSTLALCLHDFVQSSGNEELHFRYLMSRLGGFGLPVSESEATLSIPQTIEYLRSAKNCRWDTVDFYNSAAVHFWRTDDIQKALELSDLAIPLLGEAQHLGNHSYSVGRLFELRSAIEAATGNYRGSIFNARSGQKAARLAGHTTGELACLVREATALANLGHFAFALQLCAAARQLVVAGGLKNSVREILIFDLEAEIAFDQSLYSAARKAYEEILTMTNHSPRFHTYCLLKIAEIDILCVLKVEFP